MKTHTDIDVLSFILNEHNFNQDFFIVYNKKLNKILPYIPNEEERNNSLLFLVGAINVKNKDEYFLLYSREFPEFMFDKEKFVAQMIDYAAEQSIERDDDCNGSYLDVDKFLTLLNEMLHFNNNQIIELQKQAEYFYTYEDDVNEKRIYLADYLHDYDDEEFLEFQDEIGEAIMMLSKQCNSLRDTIKKAMIDNINMNKGYIEDRLNERLSAVLKIIN